MRLLILAAASLLLLVDLSRAEKAEGRLDAIRSLVAKHGLMSVSEAAQAAMTVGELVERLRADDPYFRYEPAGVPQEAASSEPAVRSLGGVIAVGHGLPVFIPFQVGPAAAAGLRKPVRLISVAGQSVAGMESRAIHDLVASGSEDRVTLETAPAHNEPVATYEVQPSPYEAPSVEILEAPEGAPLVRIYNFVPGGTVEVLRRVIDSRPPDRPLLIDLRVSQGGSLFEALDAASLFLPGGLPLAGTRDKVGRTQMLVSLLNHRVVEDPVVLLLGPYTASAAEVFAGTMQHYLSAVLIGRPTFGKCVSQAVFPLAGGGSIRLSNLEILDPTGASCQRIEPDVLVPEEKLYDTEALFQLGLDIVDRRTDSFICLDPPVRAPRMPIVAYELHLLFPRLNERMISRPSTPTNPTDSAPNVQLCVGPFEASEDARSWRERVETGSDWTTKIMSLEDLHGGPRTRLEPSDMPMRRQ